LTAHRGMMRQGMMRQGMMRQGMALGWTMRWSLLLLILALAGCGHSPPTHFYRLS